MAVLISEQNNKLRFKFASKSNEFGSVNVSRTNLLSITLTSASRNVFSLPRNAIIVYRNCSVLFRILISFAFCSSRNDSVVEIVSRSGKLNAEMGRRVGEPGTCAPPELRSCIPLCESGVLYIFNNNMHGQSVDSIGILS